MTDSTLREQITKCFGDTKMPEDDQFEPDVELFDIESTIDRLEALIALKVQEAQIEELKNLRKHSKNHTYPIGEGLVSIPLVSTTQIDTRLAALHKIKGGTK